MSGGRLIRTEAEAAAVPTCSTIRSSGGSLYVVSYGGVRVGDTLTYIAVPVEVLQRHEKAVADDVTYLRQKRVPGTAGRILARHRELWPEVLAVEPVEETADEAGLECPEVDDPTCSTCCEHADDDGYMDAAIDHHQTAKETTT